MGKNVEIPTGLIRIFLLVATISILALINKVKVAENHANELRTEIKRLEDDIAAAEDAAATFFHRNPENCHDDSGIDPDTETGEEKIVRLTY